MEDRVTLSRRSERLKHLGAVFLLIGGIAAAIGVLLMLAFDGWPQGVGVMLASLGSAPTVVGLALWLSGFTGRWVSRERPFA